MNGKLLWCVKLFSPDISIRKIVTIVEETRSEADKNLANPVRRAAAIMVLKNPYAGKFVEDLSLFFNWGELISQTLVTKALETLRVALDDAKERIESYGKGAIVGTDGEIEHTHAILHPKFGAPVRKALGGVDYCRAIIPSTAKIGPPGTTIDIPIIFKRAIWVVSHFDTMTVSIPDAPARDEMLVALVISDSGRPFARSAGWQKSQVVGLDGNK